MRSALFPIIAIIAAAPALAQIETDPEARLAPQREAMKKLSMLDGMWRGPAWTLTPTGRHELTQTERAGPFLGGSVRMIEGRGYEKDGRVSFNALAVISFDPRTKTYRMQSNAQGFSGGFEIRPTGDGFTWETPAGPGATMRYTAMVRNGTWREIGERVVAGRPPVRVFEMNLRRIGDTRWPEETPVARK